MTPRNKLLCVLVLFLAAAEALYQGCYKENVRRRHFSLSPGNYNPEQMTSLVCMSSCGDFSYEYGAIASGKFCYCADLLPDATLRAADSSCDVPCVGDPTQKCGAATFVSVYISIKKITGLRLTSDVGDTIIPVNTPVSLNVNIDSGNNVIYKFDYGDGSPITGPNATNMLSTTYQTPGEYRVMVYANDINETFQSQVAATIVRVDAVPGQMEIKCDPIFGTYEEGFCQTIIWWGSSLSLAVNVGPFSLTFFIEDPPLSLAGPTINVKDSFPGNSIQAVYLLQASEFSITGKILAWEVRVDSGQNAVVLLLKPVCSSGTYCYSSNDCSSSCPSSTSRVTSCPTNEQFCVQAAACQSSCSSVSSRYPSSTPKFVVVQVINLQITGPGYQYLKETADILVEPGYILGIQQDGSKAALAKVACDVNLCDIQFPYGDSPIGTEFTTTPSVKMTDRLAIRAIASAGSKAYLPFTFQEAGNFTLTAVAKSTTLTSSSTTTNTTTVVVIEGVNASIVTGPMYGARGELINFTVQYHTGNNVFYNWSFSDGSEFYASLNRIQSHNFSSLGVHVINVTIYNAVSRKSNYTEIIIQDKIGDMALAAKPSVVQTSTNITLTLTGGSNYTCIWNYGDQTATEQSSHSSTPSSGISKSHTYMTAGRYDMSVTCANFVNSETAQVTVVVQEAITNLRMVNGGAQKGQDFYLEWKVERGTEITYLITFDGQNLTDFTNVSKYQWKSSLQPQRPASSITLNITAFNLVSSANISTMFQILSVIKDPTFTSLTVNISSHETVKFTANMAAGSDVTITVDYGDSMNNTYTQPPGNEWAAPVVFSHMYLNGGRFNVTAYFSNAEGTYTRILQILVLVGVGAIECNLTDYALYHPPAYVNFIFQATVLPTEPILTMNWGEPQSVNIYPVLQLNTSYPHTFGDTGTYTVKANLTNLLGQKICLKEITIVEKLSGPTFQLPFTAAAIGLPFHFSYCLYRGPSGPLCNLTINFGDGSPSNVSERQGAGKDGCDTYSVTYYDYNTKTIQVNAATPLETNSANLTVPVIDGLRDSDVTVIYDGDVKLGLVTKLTLEYTGTIMPTDAHIKIEYSDGTTADSGPATFTITSKGGTQPFTHTYTKDGLYDVTVTVYNMASSVQKTVKVGVYQDFSNLRTEVFYLSDIPPGQETFNLNGNSARFPTKLIYFRLLDDNNAFATAYEITVAASTGAPVHSAIFNTSVLSVQFNQSGEYTISITAKNPFYSASIQKTLFIIELVEGFLLQEANAQVKANEPKVFNISFIKVGTDTCLYLNFGDGIMNIYSDDVTRCNKSEIAGFDAANEYPLTNLTQIEHVYGNEGYYTVTAIAKNRESNISIDVNFSISGLGCSKPTVTISNRRPYPTSPTIYKRSQKISIHGLSNIQCVESYDNIKSWRIELMNDSTITVISQVSVAGLDTTRAELNIPPRFLVLGLYRIFYSMTMVGPYDSCKFESEIYTYIRVEKSNLVGIMMKGGPSEITVGTTQTLFLQPLIHSIDPDVDPKDPQGLTVVNWTCHIQNDSSTGCDMGGFTSNGQTQTLTINKTYRITAFLQKDTRITSTEILVTVISGTPLNVSLWPAPGSVYYQLSDGYKILRSSRFTLDCLCLSCPSSSTPTYQQTVYLFDYRWPNGWRKLEPEDLEGRVMGQNANQISIQPSLFELFNATLMRVECTVTDNGLSGKTSAKLQVNTPPTPGNCSVSPFNRTISTENDWNIFVNGWTDNDGIFEYQFFIVTDNNTVDTQITSIQTNKGSLQLNVCLSEGPDYNNYQQNIFVKVRDTLGGSRTYFCGMVVVLPIEVTEIRAITQDIKTNQLHDLKRMFAEGDQKTCTEKATNIVSLLNSDSKQSRSEYAGLDQASNKVGSMYGQIDKDRPAYMEEDESVQNDLIEYKMESERNSRALVRKFLIDEIDDMNPQDVVAIQQVLSLLGQIVGKAGDEIDQASQIIVVDAELKMINFLNDPENVVNVPPEEIEIALQNCIEGLGGISDAAGISGYYGTLYDLNAAESDEQFPFYDTSIEAMGTVDFHSAESYEKALKLHIASINKMRQAKTAVVVREKIISILDKIVECFSRYSVPGQVLELKSLKMKQILEKTYVDKLKGKQLNAPDSEGGVVFPNTFLGNMDSNDTLVVSVSQSTNHPLRYSAIAGEISPVTNFISVNLYGDNNTKLSVQDLLEPVKVVIPRDANMKEPSYLFMDPMIASWRTLFNIAVTVNHTQSCIHLEFKGIENRQFLLVIKMGKLANIAKDPADDDCDIVRLMPESMTETSDTDSESRYRLSINNTILGDFTGLVSIGIRELNTSEYDMDIGGGCRSVPRYNNGSDSFKGNFSLRTFVSLCLALTDSGKDWTKEGCVAGRETDVYKTVCYCSHLTTFAGGWVVVPNTIDWSYVFANADFLKNPTIYITVIVTAVLYIIFAILARYKDKKMAEQLGIAPLADNDPRDKYFYEVIVSTGMRRNAGTDSKVYFILSGEDDETDVRALSDNKRKIFRRGQVDGFLLAVSRPLGYLNFMRVWHDNSGQGKFGSWYLNYIIIRDIQTDVKQLFIANRWFAVEEDDGQVDRVIPVANHEQVTDFSYQFGERTRKDFADGHLWYSVVARPPQSRFTCLQRVSCCLCLLYVTMLANAMFYNTASKSESVSNSLSFGPFSIAPEQIFIGVVSNLIVFPVNFLLVFLFKKSRPHHKRPSRIDLAIKEVHHQSKQTNINDIKPEVSSIFSVSKAPCLPKDPHHPETTSSRPESAMSCSSTERLTPSKKKKKFELPWYFTIIAWFLLWVVTLCSVALVIFYGISFKDETCKKWITSMIVSFFMSIFITQPIKVILFAIILSLIIKNPGEDKEDEEEDEESPCLDQDSELLHGDMSALNLTRPQKIGYKPPDPQMLEKLREKRLKEIKMWAIIREVILYAFFLWILLVISYRQMGESNFLYKDTLHKVFIDNKQTDIDFSALRNAKEFWMWAQSGLVNGLRAGAYYNDYPPLKLRAYINDKVSRILGYATLRQLRIKPGECHIPDPVRGIIKECNVAYSMFNQEEGSFAVGWKSLKDGDTLNMTRQEYTYTSAKELNGYPYWGILSWYSGGGYVVPLEGSKAELISQMRQLEEENWIDKYTRAVFVEFTVYNPQVNLFAISTILAEFHPSGGLVASVRFEPAMLLPYMTSAMLFQIVCEIIYILFALFFIIRELKELFKTKLSYFRNFWNWVEIGIIAMSISAIVIFFYRLVMTNKLTKVFKETNGNGYVKFQYVAYWNELFSYMIGFLCFLATLKFLKLLRFNRKMSMLSATLKFSAWSLINFGIIFLIVFLAFSQLFYLTFMHIDLDYATFVASMVAGVLMMMGKYDIYSMIMAEPVLTQIFVLLFVITVTFILVNMFVTILNETFSAVREDINKQGNDYEIVNFMLQRFQKWTGLGKPGADNQAAGEPDNPNNLPGVPGGQNKTDHVEDFPDRIERLLQTISSVYMDSDSLAQLYQKKPYESQFGNKNLLRHGQPSSPAPGYNQKRKGSSDILARVHTH